MRISDVRRSVAIGSLLLLGACDRKSDDPRVAAGVVEAVPTGDAGRIACRPAGAADFAMDCTAERTAVAGGQLLTLRNKDGGFRRLMLAADGRTVAAADGSEDATVTPAGSALEIAVGGDRYRLPIQ